MIMGIYEVSIPEGVFDETMVWSGLQQAAVVHDQRPHEPLS
jgi:hypothetical protein